MTKATTAGVADTNNAALSGDTAADAFLSQWTDTDGDSPSDADVESEEELVEETGSEEDEGTEETAEDAGSEDDHQEASEDEDETPAEDAEEDAEESTDEPAKVLGDDAIVKVKVGEEELDVSVKDLKRLYGQEKALTQKSQEVAAKRKEADAKAEVLDVSYQRIYDKALERFKPYAGLDMLVASKQLDAEQFAALRKEAAAAYEDFKFISEEATKFVEGRKAEHQTQMRAAAAEAIKVLKADIPNWSPKLYDDIRSYAVGKGLDQAFVNTIVDPTTIKILNQSRLYEESKKIATKKKVAVPKKVLKTTLSTSTKDTKGNSKGAAAVKFAKSGSVDDATDLFLSRWASDEE